MMIEHIRYLNLPQIPANLLGDFLIKSQLCPDMPSPFYKTGEYCQEITDWCQNNISPDVFYGVQIMDEYVPPHKDKFNEDGYPECKLVYLVDSGGDKVRTCFWDESGNFIKSYIVEPFKWHLLQVNVLHSVEGIQPPRKRWGVTTQVFHHGL